MGKGFHIGWNKADAALFALHSLHLFQKKSHDSGCVKFSMEHVTLSSLEFLFLLREFLDCQCLPAHQSLRDEELNTSLEPLVLYNPEASNTVFMSALWFFKT